MKYIVDIDGTICDTPNEDGINRYWAATPIPENIEKINRLYHDGHQVIYWTARGEAKGLDWRALTEAQLKEWGALYHDLHMMKPSYDVWIDDRAISAREFFDAG